MFVETVSGTLEAAASQMLGGTSDFCLTTELQVQTNLKIVEENQIKLSRLEVTNTSIAL